MAQNNTLTDSKAVSAGWLATAPIMLGFFVMGFVDVVGIATNFIKSDFALDDTLANLIPMMVFLWFALLSIPSGILMNRIGRKKSVVLSMVVTTVALLIPTISYCFVSMLIAFGLLGIGNTVLQVSLNPLLTNVVSGNRITGMLSLGQFVKAIASFLGPILAAYAASLLGSWSYIFPIYGAITLISMVWVLATPIAKEPLSDISESVTKSFANTLRLLSDRHILLLFLNILFIVGIDVGLNTSIPKLLMERCGFELSEAGYGTSLYFIARTVGAFLGALILSRISAKLFFPISMVVAMLGMVGLLVGTSSTLLLTCIFIVGFACANVFSITFAYGLSHRKESANQVSSLMIMGIGGAAVILPVMGIISDAFGQVGAFALMAACLAYILCSSIYLSLKK